MIECVEIKPPHIAWYRLWYRFRRWRAIRLACSYTVTREEISDNLYKIPGRLHEADEPGHIFAEPSDWPSLKLTD